MYDLTELAQNIASHLGEDWTALAADPPHGWRDLLHTDGPQLRLRFTGHRSSAGLLILGLFPGNVRDHGGEPRRSISAATARGPRAIAADIRRRLLPDYLPAWERVRSFQREQASAATARRALADRILLHLPTARVTSSPADSHIRADTVEWSRRGGPRLTLRMRDTPDTVDFRIDELPADTATRICELLAHTDGPSAKAETLEGFPPQWDVLLYRGDDGTPVVDVATGEHDEGRAPRLRIYVNDVRIYQNKSPAPMGEDPPRKLDPPEPEEVRELLGRRVLVVTDGGDRSRGVLADVTEEHLALAPPVDGADVVPFPRVAKVVPLGPRADAGIWTLTASGLIAVYPALAREGEDRDRPPRR